MQVDTILIALNLAVYLSLIAAVIQGRRRAAIAKVPAATGNFADVESALRRSFPDLPQGFTMREGLSRANQVEPGLGWDQIGKSLREYEAHRYGDDPAPQGDQSE